ncbi:hypothetical protein NECID01_0999 [Nematocida sp. AWRm77]|nr:hypothetical protein NECID01_0999 [Nematocida sp. AWRm77]
MSKTANRTQGSQEAWCPSKLSSKSGSYCKAAKSMPNISIIDYILTHSHIPSPRHALVKLLKQQNRQKENEKKKQNTLYSASIQIVTSETNTRVAVSFPVLVPWHPEPVIKWRDTVEDLTLAYQIKTKEILRILPHIIDPKYITALDGCTTVIAALDSIARKVLAEEQVWLHTKCPQQKSYLLIESYYVAVANYMRATKLIRLDRRCATNSPQIAVEDIFHLGLTHATCHFLMRKHIKAKDYKAQFIEIQLLERIYLAKIERAQQDVPASYQFDPAQGFKPAFCRPNSAVQNSRPRVSQAAVPETVYGQKRNIIIKDLFHRYPYQDPKTNEIQGFSNTHTEEEPEYTPAQRENLEALTRELYNHLGHPGITKAYNTLKKVLPPKNLKKTLQKLRKECLMCQKHQVANTSEENIPLGHLQTSEPFRHICTDIAGPYLDTGKGVCSNAESPKAQQGATQAVSEQEAKEHRYLLTIADRCTHWTQIYVLPKLAPKDIIAAFRSWCSVYQTPESVLYNQRKQFASAAVDRFLKQSKVKQIKASPFSLTGKAVSNRIKQEISFVLSHFLDTGIERAAQIAQTRLCITYHRVIKCTPWELVKGTHPLDPEQKPVDVEKKLQHAKEVAQQKEEQNMAVQRQKYNTFELGQRVYVRNKGPGSENAAMWLGPYPIVKMNQQRTVLTLTTETGAVQRNVNQVRA